jgi:hypothetical protein
MGRPIHRFPFYYGSCELIVQNNKIEKISGKIFFTIPSKAA